MTLNRTSRTKSWGLSPVGRRLLLLGLALAFASSIAATMVIVRLLYTGQFRFVFLIWNLFLAWLPYGFAVVVYRWRERPLLVAIMGGMWLLFLPNTLYLVTDLIHLYPSSLVPFWYDAIMLFAFALTGLMLGLVSLYLLHAVVTRYAGPKVGWGFALFVSGLCGLGVYIGRFLRWNSWDVFTNPATLLRDLAANLGQPNLFVQAVVSTGLLTAVFLLAYIALVTTPQLALDGGE